MDFLRAALADAKNKTKRKFAESACEGKQHINEDGDEDGDRDGDGVKKFKTRGEIDAERREKLQREKEERIRIRARQEKLQQETHQQTTITTKSSTFSAPASASFSTSTSTPPASVDDDRESISANEVKMKLRLAAQPITLFGETDAQRLARLKQYEMLAHEKETGSTGRHNLMQDIQTEIEDELAKAMAEETERARLLEERGASSSSSSSLSLSLSGSTDDSSLVELENLEKQKAQEKAAKETQYSQEMTRSSFTTPEDYVLHFFKRMLREWELDLQNRPREVKRSTRGKLELATQKQTRQYMKPLFKQLKARKTDADVIQRCEKIVNYCLARQYDAANEEYLTLAIGNAPWPIGVTMVSIHERSGRENLFAQNQAHVLNDETQRKYIQSMKRLMTYCSQKYPRSMRDNSKSAQEIAREQALQEADDEAFLAETKNSKRNKDT